MDMKSTMDAKDYSSIISTCSLWSGICANEKFVDSSPTLSLARLRFNKKRTLRMALRALTQDIRDRFADFVAADLRACEWLMENVDLFNLSLIHI